MIASVVDVIGCILAVEIMVIFAFANWCLWLLIHDALAESAERRKRVRDGN